jgi:DNA-binding PadR family transcriptional regulator
LRSEWSTTQGPARRYYALSDDGMRLYQRLTASWRGLNEAMTNLLEGN